MYIGSRYLNGSREDGRELAEKPLKSQKIEEIMRRVRRRTGE